MKEKFHEYQKMFSVENTLWWYRILHLLIFKAVKRNFDSRDVSVLDAGCGTGGMMKFLIDKGYRNIEGFDVSEHAIAFTRKNNLAVTELNLLDFTESKLEKKFDVIISNDTLCYFDDPEEQKRVLSNFYNNINEDGIVVMNLPALDQFEGIHDIAVGLKMRFNVERIEKLVDPAKFEIVEKRFWPFLLSPLIYFIRRSQKRKIERNDFEVVSDIDVPLAPVNFLLYLLTRIEIAIFGNYPFGSSLMVTLKKKRQV